MRGALTARVAPLPSVERGLEAELTLSVPSDIEFIEEAVALVARHLEASFVDRRTIRFNLCVALSEALTNAILYGNGEGDSRDVDLRVLFGRNTIEIEVRDCGDGFDPRFIPDPTLPANRERPYGRGLFLIRRLMDEVRFNESGNSICMILRRA